MMPPIEQQRRQDAHHQHHRQRLEGEDEFAARALYIEWRARAADVAEHERSTSLGRRCDYFDGAIDPVESDRRLWQLQHQERQAERHREPSEHRPPRHRPAILTHEPGQRDNGDDAKRRLQVLQHERSPVTRC
jgi:hypothetical protein